MPDRPPAESWLVVALRAVALAATAAALLLDVALPAGTIAAVAGTALASIVAARVARSRVRLVAVWALAAAAVAVGLLAGEWLTNGALGPSLLGVRGAMAAGDLVRFGLLATGLTLALRTTSARAPVAQVGELAVVALGLAGVFAAHRDGMINRPRELSDWAWTTGHDPVKILLWVGVATLLALVASTLRERKGRSLRVVLHLGVAGALALALLGLVQVLSLAKPPRGEGLGLSGNGSGPKDARGRSGQASGGGRGRGDQLDQLEFKDDYSSASQNAPVAVVLLRDDYSPPLGYYYFRQTAFSQFNGHRLVARTRDDIDRDIVTDFPTEPTRIPNAPRPGKERTQVRSTVALLADHLKPFGLETPVELAPRESPDPSRFLRAYDVTSAALAMRYEDLLGKRSMDAGDAAAAYTQLPSDPRYKELADKIVSTTLKPEYRGDPFAQAIAISAWLSKQSTYSMKSKHAEADDPTADFLFGDRIGYCVHFAHAAAYLLRARGLPSRIAAGYVADEGRKGSGSTIMLRQKDAHAWAELYLEGFGWIIVDVAPERTLDPPDTPPDQDLQRMLGELARGDPKAGKLPPPKREWPELGRVARRAGELLLALVAALYLAKIWRRLAPLVAGPRSIYRVAYRAVLDRLVEVGVRREHGETRERFAERAAALAPSLSALTAQHVGRAYGSRALVPPTEMRELGRRASRELRSRAAWWRILIGLLNPISWTMSR